MKKAYDYSYLCVCVSVFVFLFSFITNFEQVYCILFEISKISKRNGYLFIYDGYNKGNIRIDSSL